MNMCNPQCYRGDGLRAAAEKGMQQKLGVAEDFHLSYVYLCTTEESKTKQLCGHWGEHIEIMEGVLQMSITPRIFADMKGDLAKTSTRDEFNILFLCNTGRHKSIAMSKFVECILQCEGILGRPVVHVSKSDWSKNFCTRCNDCGEFSDPERRQLQYEAFEMWNEVKAKVSS